MPPRKKTSRKKSATVPAGLKWLAAVLVVLAIGGVVAVKYMQTPRGKVALVDRGLGAHYDEVLEQTDLNLRASLEKFDLRRGIVARTRTSKVRGRTITRRDWTIVAADTLNLVAVNVALTHASSKSGVHVRKSEETDRGRVLTLSIGTAEYETHHITIRLVQRSAAEPPGRARSGLPRVAIIIDDLGYTRNGIAADMVALDMPLTFAVLPTLRYTDAMLTRARARGRCVLLHLPMESAQGYPTDMTPITVAMADDEITALVRRYVESEPGIDGVNNHQGSRATADARVMKAVMKGLQGTRLFFLDSLTSPNSVAYNTAREAGVPAARNSIFLDDDTEDVEVVESRIRELMTTARKHGSAIGIGHPHSFTLEALVRSQALLMHGEVELAPVRELVTSEEKTR